MNTSTLMTWEDRLTRLSLALLLGATAYGVVVGATITMYYDTVPNMGALEDNLGAPQLILYLLAILISLAHLPLVLADARHALWQQAAIRAAACVGPLIIFLGTDGLVAHFLWWSPLSDTDRFHILHHSLFAGVPLTLSYWLLLRWGWRPATFKTIAAPSLRAWLVSVIVLVWMVMGIGTLSGLFSPITFGATLLIGLIALPLLWRMAKP